MVSGIYVCFLGPQRQVVSLMLNQLLFSAKHENKKQSMIYKTWVNQIINDDKYPFREKIKKEEEEEEKSRLHNKFTVKEESSFLRVEKGMGK